MKKTEPEPEPSHGTEAQSDSVAQLLNSAAAEVCGLSAVLVIAI